MLVHRLVADEVSAAWLLDEVGQSIGAGLWGQELGPAPLLRGRIERVAAVYASSADVAEQIAIWDAPARGRPQRVPGESPRRSARLLRGSA